MKSVAGGALRGGRLRTAAFAFALITPAAAAAQLSKPIRFIMAAPAGSSIDVLGRVLAERMREGLEQSIVVENVPAAAGTVATATVARAPADGQTLGISFNGPLAFAPYLYTRLGYDPLKDLQPIILTTSQPNVLAVASSVPARSVRELVDYARAERGKMSYASVGNGSSSHLTMELFKSVAAIEAVHVPFNGSPPALNALASGDAQMIFAVPTAIAPLAQAGKVRMLAVTSAKRWALLADLPPLAESGLPGFEAFAWNGVIAPAGLAAGRVARLNEVLDRILHEPAVKLRLNAAGLEPVGGSAAGFAALIESEARKWAPVIRRTGLRID